MATRSAEDNAQQSDSWDRNHEQATLDKEAQQNPPTGLRPVEFRDGQGEVLSLCEADGLLLSVNVCPEVLTRRHSLLARHDDVLIASYPKSGSHWTWEIVSMLTKHSRQLLTETVQNVDYMPEAAIDAIPSPRVLCTHMPFSRIPRDFLSRGSGCKVVWVVRNPWDVAVSYYHFIRNLVVFDYGGTWDGFFDLYLEGSVPYNSWFEHTQDWIKGISTMDILLLRYEDLHNNFQREVGRIAKYLGVDAPEATVRAIETETSFANMARNKTDQTIPISRDGTSPIFRKGRCGDWHNWFSPEQTAELRGAYRASLKHHQTLFGHGRPDNRCPQS